MRDIDKIISDNKARNGKMDAFYDPVTGIGSPIGRRGLVFSDWGSTVYIPLSMFEEGWVQVMSSFGSFAEAANYFNVTQEELYSAYVVERFKHDFEFWAYICIVILDKDLFKNVPFKLRGAQRKLLAELEYQRTAWVPIRIVLLKARQWGGSTLVQMYMMWIQQIHRDNWHLAVCAQGDDAAKHISGMYDTAASSYPADFGKITFRPYKGSSKNKQCVETNGIIGVGSVNNPDQFRTYNYAMCHLSEVGVYQDTPKRSATKLITSLKETVPDQPYTLIVEESTANGLNYFHDSWLKATSGKTRYKAVFVAWWEIDRCRTNITVPIEKFIDGMNDYDWFCWELGATLEGINWYNLSKADRGYSDWMMQQENPSTAEEAFISSGQKVFAPDYVNAIRKDCTDPIFIGDVFGKSRQGPLALENIELREVPRGKLWVWKKPDIIKGTKIKHRFCAMADIGGRTDKADYSVLKLFDREPMIYAEDPEVILVWHGHLDQDLFAWKCAQICIAYGQPEINEYPLLAFETQSLRKDMGTEGDHSLIILDTIKDYYPNLYIRNDAEKIGDEFVPKYGIHTTTKNKTNAINVLNGAMRERLMRQTDDNEGFGYVEKDKRACDEFMWFETKQDGSMGAIQGKNDDHVIVTAFGSWLAINRMPTPFIVNTAPRAKKRKTGSYGRF